VPPHGAFTFQTLVLFAACELGREPFRTHPGGGPLCVRQQRTLHHRVLVEVRSERRCRIILAPSADDAIRLIAHGASIGIRGANLAS
jgi:hypothetical protein